jgi:arginase family enzyme
VAGLLPHSVSADHLEFVRARGEAVFSRDVMRATIVRLFSEPETNVLASFDLDAVDRAWAPGVSAPATGGLSVDLWLEAAYRAAASPLVSSLDLVELNPLVDRDGQTAALAALTVWWMLKGVCDRPAAAGPRSPRAR